MASIVIRGSIWKVTTQGQSISYEMGNAPKFVQHALRLITQKWGTSLDDSNTAQKAVMHKARLLAEKYGVGHP